MHGNKVKLTKYAWKQSHFPFFFFAIYQHVYYKIIYISM